MSVVRCEELHRGRPSTSGKGVTEYTRTFQIETDNPLDNAATIYGSGALPAYLSAHPDDANCTLRDYAVTPTDETRIVWEAECKYSNERQSQEEEQRQNQPTPHLRPAEHSWEGVAREVALTRDRTGARIVNTVGDPFDPPLMATVFDIVLTISKNMTAVPIWLFDYQGSVNSGPFTVDGISVDTGCALMGPVRISPIQTESIYTFRNVQLQLHFRAPRDPVDEDDTPPEPWKVEVLNAGLRQKLAVGGKRVNIYDDATPPMPVTSPWPLAEDGTRLPSNYALSALHYLTFDVHKRRDFTALPLT